MFTSLPWQLDVLVVEALISLVCALVMSEFGYYQRTPQWGIVFFCCDVTCIVLMIWGGHLSWQHVVYCILYAWAAYNGLVKGFKRQRENLRTTDKGQPISKGFMQGFAAFMSLIVIILITTGQ